MKPTDVLYCVEHVARELDIACAVRHMARRDHGLAVEVISLVGGECALRNLRPRVIAVPYFYAGDDAGIHRLLRRFPGVPIVNLAFEQLYSPVTKEFKRPQDSISRENVLHLAAGEFFREFLCGHGVREANVQITGSLACGLSLPPYRDYFAGRRAEFARLHGLDATKPWVFFPENFAAAFFGERAIEKRVCQGARREDVLAYRDFTLATFRTLMPWCADAAETESVELVIRPRPATPREAFIEAFREVVGRVPRTGLHFVKDASVREWILASDLTVSSYSSTLIEAALAGRPAYLLAPERFPECVRTDWCDLPPQLTEESQFLDLIAQPDRALPADHLAAWADEHLLARGDPIARTTATLASIVLGRQACPPPSPPVGPRFHDAVKRFGKTFERLGRYVFPKRTNPRSDFYENDHFTLQDVERRTERWAAVLAARTSTVGALKRKAA